MKARLPKGMGGGAQNMNAMIRQAQQMQEDMTNLQEELDAKEYEVSAGGGVVTIKINGKTVNRILMKGKDFFGTDKDMALKNISVDAVDKVKFYDKMKALELLGKLMGFLEGENETVRNNLLEAILAATQEDVDTHDIPEIQQAADAGDDLVEPSGSWAL